MSCSYFDFNLKTACETVNVLKNLSERKNMSCFNAQMSRRIFFFRIGNFLPIGNAALYTVIELANNLTVNEK